MTRPHVGDFVRCIDAKGLRVLKEGGVYQVVEVGTAGTVRVARAQKPGDEAKRWRDVKRFEKIEDRREKLVRGRARETAVGPILTRPVRDRSEHRALLALKLHEEVSEVLDAPGDRAEYADVLEVLQCLARLNGVDWDLVTSAQTRKYLQRGGFDEGVVMVGRRGDPEYEEES